MAWLPASERAHAREKSDPIQDSYDIQLMREMEHSIEAIDAHRVIVCGLCSMREKEGKGCHWMQPAVQLAKQLEVVHWLQQTRRRRGASSPWWTSFVCWPLSRPRSAVPPDTSCPSAALVNTTATKKQAHHRNLIFGLSFTRQYPHTQSTARR